MRLPVIVLILPLMICMTYWERLDIRREQVNAEIARKHELKLAQLEHDTYLMGMDYGG